MLTALTPLDLKAVELALQEFLEELEGMGRGLSAPPDGAALLLWAVAGATAALACEIAHRQWKRPADETAVTLDRMPGPFPFPLLAD